MVLKYCIEHLNYRIVYGWKLLVEVVVYGTCVLKLECIELLCSVHHLFEKRERFHLLMYSSINSEFFFFFYKWLVSCYTGIRHETVSGFRVGYPVLIVSCSDRHI